MTHPSAGIPSLTVEQQQEEVMGNHQYIKDTFGYEMNLFRYPAGKFSEQSLAVVNNCGYESVFWSFAYLDYDVDNQPDQAESLQKMKNKMHPGTSSAACGVGNKCGGAGRSDRCGADAGVFVWNVVMRGA